MKASHTIRFVLLCLLLAGPLTPTATAQDTLRTYIFGHSLINHEFQVNPTPSNETSVPHWFQDLAQTAGYSYEVAGQYGFIPQHANLPPIAQWGFDSVAPAWDDQFETFAQASFSNVLITPGNFIQWQGPSVNYFQDTQSPLDYTNQIFNWVNQQKDSLTLYVYENWPDMGGYLNNGFPPSQSEWQQYNDYLNGDFHDWFLEYHDSLILAHPNTCVRMIPVGPVISDLLTLPPFNQIAIDTLYEDDAPHGRPTIYFLAALTTYMAMYEELAPANYTVPAIIDPIVANNYGTAVTFIWDQLQAFNDSLGNNRVFCDNGIVLDIDENHSFGFEEEGFGENALEVFPNPTTGRLNIRSDWDEMQVRLFDVTGKELALKMQETQEIDLSHLPNGLYFLRATQPTTGRTVHRRITKRN